MAHAKSEPTWAPSHSSKIIGRLELDVFPWIGAKAVSAIRPTELLSLLKRVEERDAIETTHRVSSTAARSFVLRSAPAAPSATRAAIFAAP